MKKIILGAIILAMAFTTACSKQEEQSKPLAPAKVITGKIGSPEDLKVTEQEINQAKKIAGDSMIGVLPCTMTTEYHFALGNSTKKELERYGFRGPAG